MSKRRWLAVGGSVAMIAGLGVAGWANRRLFLVNDVTTGESTAYPTLRSRVYYAEPNAVLVAAEQAVRSLRRWRVVHIDSDNETVDAEVETLIGGFLDDVTVYVIPIGHGQVRVTIRSRSREGKGDLGQNAQHIQELQDVMDARLTQRSAAF